jgi:hypothetical protein
VTRQNKLVLLGIAVIGASRFALGIDPSLVRGQDPVELIEDGDFVRPLDGSWVVDATNESIVSAKGNGFKRALRLEVSTSSHPHPGDVGMHVTVGHLVHLGDTVYIRVWMRATPLGHDGSFRTQTRFERTVAPFNKLIDQHVSVKSKWKEYKFAATAEDQYLPGEAQVTFLLEPGSGALEMANLRVEDLGDTPVSSLRLKRPKT